MCVSQEVINMKKKKYSVTKDYKHTRVNTGEACIKEGKKYRYFFPLNTKRKIKGKLVEVTYNKQGKITNYKRV